MLSGIDVGGGFAEAELDKRIFCHGRLVPCRDPRLGLFPKGVQGAERGANGWGCDGIRKHAAKGEQLSFLSRALCIFTRLLLPAVATDSDASSLH